MPSLGEDGSVRRAAVAAMVLGFEKSAKDHGLHRPESHSVACRETKDEICVTVERSRNVQKCGYSAFFPLFHQHQIREHIIFHGVP